MTLRNYTTLSQLLAVITTGAIAATPWIAEPKLDSKWQGKHQHNVNNTVYNGATVQVLFYGNSITEQWGRQGKAIFDEYYAPLNTANYGIGGDRTENVLWRITNGEVTENLNPALCVLEIGTNNLPVNNNDTSIAVGIIFIVRELQQRLPETKILLIGLLPRTNEALTNRTSAINDIIKKLDNGKSVRFLDMKNHFYNGGNNFIEELYTPDLLHLSEAGYIKWAEVMNPIFNEMLLDNDNGNDEDRLLID